MCGRARCALSREAYVQATGLDVGRWQPHLADQYEPRNNIAPGGWLPVIRTTTHTGDGPEVAICKWGLVPSYHKQEDKFDHWLMFNARSETVTTSPVFRRLMPNKRCIVLLNGFYEWKAEAGGRKQPYYIYLKDTDVHHGKAQDSKLTLAQPSGGTSPSKSGGKASPSEQLMAVAALWDVTNGPDGQPLPTVSILTCDSCSSLTWLHDRMPVILDSKEAAEAWLGAALPSAWAVHGSAHSSQPGDSTDHKADQSELQQVQGHVHDKHGQGHEVDKQEQGQASDHAQAQMSIKDEQSADTAQQAQSSVQTAGANTAGKSEGHKGSVQLPEEVKQAKEELKEGGHEGLQEEEEAVEQQHKQKGSDAGLVVRQVCHPYAGSNLAWHPVTPQMTKMEYQAADCYMDVRSRKGTITSFFSPKKATAAARNADDCQASGDAGSMKKKAKLT